MLHIRCGGRLDICGRKAKANRPIALRRITTERASYVAIIPQATGCRELTLPHTITGLRIINTRVYFAISDDPWTDGELSRFVIQLCRSRIYNLPSYLARRVRIQTRGTNNTIDVTESTYRSRQSNVDISECNVNVLHALVVENDFVLSMRHDRANIDEIWVAPPRMAPNDQARMRASLAHLMLAPIMLARAAGEIDRVVGLLTGALGFTPITDETTPDPLAGMRSALSDRVDRLRLLASIRGPLYAAETDLMAWLREARPKLVERVGTHQLTDAVAEAAANLASVRVVHAPRPQPAMAQDGDALCDLCCEFARSVRVCARCADGVVCGGCVDRLVLETAKPVCPLCRGPLHTTPTE